MLAIHILSFLSSCKLKEYAPSLSHRALHLKPRRVAGDVILHMGLYDDLNSNHEEDDDYEEVLFLPPLFSFKPDGSETNN